MFPPRPGSLFGLTFSFSEVKAVKLSLFSRAASTDKKKPKKQVQYVDPPDGGWGWMVVIHCFLVRPMLQASINFYVNSLGVKAQIQLCVRLHLHFTYDKDKSSFV